MSRSTRILVTVWTMSVPMIALGAGDPRGLNSWFVAVGLAGVAYVSAMAVVHLLMIADS